VVTKANGVLNLLADTLSGAAVSVVVMAALTLVESLLGSALLVVRLEAARDTVSGISEALLELVLGGLGGVRSELLLGLGREILATGVRHDVDLVVLKLESVFDCCSGCMSLKLMLRDN
jgi:hypothetical protein